MMIKLMQIYGISNVHNIGTELNLFAFHFNKASNQQDNPTVISQRIFIQYSCTKNFKIKFNLHPIWGWVDPLPTLIWNIQLLFVAKSMRVKTTTVLLLILFTPQPTGKLTVS